MKVSSPGFKDLAVNGFNIKAGSRVTYNARLDVGSVSETVTVAASDGAN